MLRVALHARHVLDDPTVLEHFWLIMDGIYIWEFITSLGYEWSVIRGHRPYQWTIWVYTITRLSALSSVIIDLISLNTTARFNCQVWVTFSSLSSTIGLCTGSLLLALRTIAIWHKNKVIVAITTGLYMINASILISSSARIRAIWFPLAKTCIVTNLGTSKPSLISLFTTDFLLLAMMLAGLLRLRRRGSGTFELGRLLWKQGIIWFAVSLVVELLQLVFLFLDLNAVLDELFLLPSMLTLAIASTRLYRSLANFSSPVESEAQDSHDFLRRARTISKHAPFVHTSTNRLEVTVHKAHEEHTNHYPSSSDVQLPDKSHEIRFDDSSTIVG